MKTNLKIDWATHEASKYAVENWHYSESMPVSPIVKVGVWENSKFIGVVLFSRGASANLLKPYGLTMTEGCELTRVALSNHVTPVSRIVSIAIKFLVSSNPKLKLIVSFADPGEGHHGGIYQAGNWVYCGRTSSTYKYADKSGRELHSRQVSEKGFNVQQGQYRRAIKPSECTRVLCEGKHRYLMPLDSNMRKQVSLLRKPYPKRAGSIVVDVSGFQSEEGGAIPTPALQIKDIEMPNG